MLITLLVFVIDIVALFFFMMTILYLPLTALRTVMGPQVRRRGLIALTATVLLAVLLALIPNQTWNLGLQFGLLAVFCFIALNFHAAVRLLSDCPLPKFDGYLVMATLMLLTMVFVTPNVGIFSTLAVVQVLVFEG